MSWTNSRDGLLGMLNCKKTPNLIRFVMMPDPIGSEYWKYLSTIGYYWHDRSQRFSWHRRIRFRMEQHLGTREVKSKAGTLRERWSLCWSGEREAYASEWKDGSRWRLILLCSLVSLDRITISSASRIRFTFFLLYLIIHCLPVCFLCQ